MFRKGIEIFILSFNFFIFFIYAVSFTTILCYSDILLALALTLIVLAHTLIALAHTSISLAHLNSNEKMHRLT